MNAFQFRVRTDRCKWPTLDVNIRHSPWEESPNGAETNLTNNPPPPPFGTETRPPEGRQAESLWE